MFNLKKLYYTDKKSEMVEIGRQIAESYDQTTLLSLKADVNKYDESLFVNGKENWNREELLYKVIYDYWTYGFQPIEQSQYRLFNKSHEEKSTYLSDQNKFVYLSRLNHREDMHMLEDKYEAYELLKQFYKREVIRIEKEEDFPIFSNFIEKYPEFIVKPIGLYCAIGVRKVDSRDYSDKKELLKSLLLSVSEYDNRNQRWTKHPGLVLEEIIVQDDDFSRIYPVSTNGVIITTVRINERVHICYPWLKVGVANDIIASAAQGGFDAGIDASTGILDTDGFLEDGSAIEYHPVTKVKIKGYKIPKWDEAISMAKEVAMSLPRTINYVGWDFVLTPKGWIVMEGNFYGDPMWQMYYQKGMKDDFEKLINWKPEDKFWWKQNLKKIEEW